MSRPIEDYAAIGDGHTAALIAINGSLDWLCLPQFDSPACFASLLGDDRNGHWLIGPDGEHTVSRRYVDDTAVLETTYTTDTGEVRVTDLMPTGERRADVDPQRRGAQRHRHAAAQLGRPLRLRPHPALGAPREGRGTPRDHRHGRAPTS